MSDDETGVDKRVLAAAEVYRDRLIGQYEAAGLRIVREQTHAVDRYRVEVIVTDWRTGERLLEFVGTPAELRVAIAAADPAESWVWSRAVAHTAAEQATRAVRDAEDGAA